MFRLKNCYVILNKNINFNVTRENNLLLIKQQQQRQQPAVALRFRSTAPAAAVKNEVNSEVPANKEWQNAKPFEEIPNMSLLNMIKNFIPGGKYANLDSTKLMEALRKDLGNVSYLPGFLGRQGIVITYNVEDFEVVLRNEGIWPVRPGSEGLQYHRHVHRADFFQGIEGLIATQGETWGTFRSAVNPVMMQPKNVQLYLHKMSQVNKEFVERIRQIRDPQTLEVPDTFEEEINRWTLESVSVVALDKQLGLINKNRDNPAAKELFQALNDFFVLSLELEFKPSLWRYYKTKTFRNLMKTLDKITDITSSYVQEAIERIEEDRKNGVPEKPEKEKSVLEKLIKIDKRIATVMAMDMLMAGVDTTTTTFTSLMLCLAKSPEKQEKLRQEILKILPQKDSEFDENALKNMPYLRACIKESQRIYPLAVGNARVVANDIVISGYRVPKGTQVSLCTVSLIRNSDYYPQPHTFLPERWLRSTKESNNNSECPHNLKPSNPFLHLPFGFGARSCIGRRIVEMELELGIARILRNYQIEFNYPTENAFRSLLINVPNIPLKFKFTDLDY